MSIVTADAEHSLFVDRTSPLRNKVAYDDASKLLFVEQNSKRDTDVLEFMAKLDNHSLPFSIEYKQHDQLLEMYKHNKSDVSDNSKIQKDVLVFIERAVKDRVSDIHIIVDDEKTEIKYRQLGRLVRVSGAFDGKFGMELLRTIYSTMTDNSDTYFKEKLKQDARIEARFVEKLGLYGGRVATTPTDKGVLMVIRLFYSSEDVIPDLSTLGYSNAQVVMLKKMLLRKSGIVVLSGVTGSGKTTSLEKMMKMMIAQLEGRKHFLTIENPPENAIPGANQTPVLCEDFNDDDQVSAAWSKSLSNSLRLDPDVIMVGEIRDINSAKAAIQASGTGHLVLTTTHTYDAISILDRLIFDMGVNSNQLLNHRLVIGMVNQSLVPVLCSNCKVPLKGNESCLTADELARLNVAIPVEKREGIFLTGAGCDMCGGKGLSGRVIVAEIIHPDKGFMDAYRDKGANAARDYWINKLQGITKQHHLLQRIIDGEVDPKVAEEEIGPLDED